MAWHDPEEIARRADEERKARNLAIWFLSIVGALVLALMIAHAIIVYDDWRCAFAECRIVKPVPR